MFDDTATVALDFHHSMLTDERRTNAFLEAILRTVSIGDVVVDLGAGTGVLSMFACLAGARQVYAIEQGPIIDVARAVVQRNGFADRIEFLEGWSADVELPEAADVIVTETVGNMAFDEGIVATVHDARRRFLKPGGRCVPSAVQLEIALVESFGDYVELDRWSRRGYTFDFSPFRTKVANNPADVSLSPAALVSEPATIISVDLEAIKVLKLGGARRLVATRPGVVHGIGCWFATDLGGGARLSSRPPNSVPSWSHVLLPLDAPIEVDELDELQVEIATDASGETWSWGIDAGSDRTESHGTVHGRLGSRPLEKRATERSKDEER